MDYEQNDKEDDSDEDEDVKKPDLKDKKEDNWELDFNKEKKSAEKLPEPKKDAFEDLENILPDKTKK